MTEHDGDDEDLPTGDDWDVRQFAFYEQAKRPLEEDDCAETVCKALAAIGFEGLRDDDTVATVAQDDPETVWQHKLEREGKRQQGRSLGRLIEEGRAGSQAGS